MAVTSTWTPRPAAERRSRFTYRGIPRANRACDGRALRQGLASQPQSPLLATLSYLATTHGNCSIGMSSSSTRDEERCQSDERRPSVPNATSTTPAHPGEKSAPPVGHSIFQRKTARGRCAGAALFDSLRRAPS